MVSDIVMPEIKAKNSPNCCYNAPTYEGAVNVRISQNATMEIASSVEAAFLQKPFRGEALSKN